jgi:hypothetical protein
MYSQMSMAGEPIIDDCNPLGTHRTPCLVSIIDEMKLMEGYPLEGDN